MPSRIRFIRTGGFGKKDKPYVSKCCNGSLALASIRGHVIYAFEVKI